MELLHCEKLRKQKTELEKAEMDLVSVKQSNRMYTNMCTGCHFVLTDQYLPFQGEYEFSPEILSGKLAEIVYRDCTEKIKGIFF